MGWKLRDRLIGFARAVRRSVGSRVLLAAGVFFLLGAIPGGVLGFKAYRFSWVDPRFCFFCHIHDYANIAWKKSGHGEVTTCHDCHHIPLLHYTYIGAKTFINRPTYPEDLEQPPDIPNDLCIQCHVRGAIKRENWTNPLQYDRLKKIPAVDVTAGHRWHMGALTDKPTVEVLKNQSAKATVERGFNPKGIINCRYCHGSKANRPHNYRATDANCRSCHADSHLSDQLRFAGTDCLLCHINAFVLDYRNPAAQPLRPEQVKEKMENLEELLKELKQKYPIEEMVAE